jgi:hypothetical protein
MGHESWRNEALLNNAEVLSLEKHDMGLHLYSIPLSCFYLMGCDTESIDSFYQYNLAQALCKSYIEGRGMVFS